MARVVRSGVFAAASLGLAVAAHVLGGGLAPSRPMVLVGGAVLTAFGVATTGRERRGGFIGACVVGTQFVLHVSFVLSPLSSGPTQDQTALWARILFCHHGTQPITTAQVLAARATMGLSHAALPASVGHAPGQAQDPGLWGVVTASPWLLAMLLAHLAAAVVMAWWLRCGERRAWVVVRRVAEAISTPVLMVAIMSAPEAVRSSALPVEDASSGCARPRWAQDIQRRGPPDIS